jgi:hypothetical protein
LLVLETDVLMPKFESINVGWFKFVIYLEGMRTEFRLVILLLIFGKLLNYIGF